MTAMTPEKQRIAIAKACGWENVTWNGGDSVPFGDNPQGNRSKYACDHLPDYLNDLNAMQEALVYCYKAQPAGWAEKFQDNLREVCSRRQYPYWFEWCAEASDLAESLLKTLNLWKP